jgi:hypothetical protein
MTRISNSRKGSDDLLLVDFIRIVRCAIPIERGFPMNSAVALTIAGGGVQSVCYALFRPDHHARGRDSI